MNGRAVNTKEQPKVLTLSPNGSGGVKIYASMNISKQEKLELLKKAINYLEKENHV